MRSFSIGLGLALAAFGAGCTDPNPDATGVKSEAPMHPPVAGVDMAGMPNPNPNPNPTPVDMATPPDPVHALGTIQLGESHPAAGGTATALVAASFSPTADAPHDCAMTLSGCRVVVTPSCGTSCAIGQVCAYDASCTPACTKTCSLSCAAGEECYFPAPNTPGCRVKQVFDAGVLAFAGTTTPLTLYPPYTFSGTQSGAPFLAGSQIEVQASGAASAGFDQFDEKFTATTFLQTSPRINLIGRSTVFGTGSIQIGWAAGSDQVIITASGGKGTATCKATDASGSYTLAREVLNAILSTSGTPQLSLSVSRERREMRTSEHTKGSLIGVTVPSIGWVELVTRSTESATFTGCSSSQTLCGNDCSTLEYDNKHCGSCSNACAAGDTCELDTCAGPTACTACIGPATLSGGACKAEVDACSADSACTNLRSCIHACSPMDSNCPTTCESTYSTGITNYDAIATCLCDSTVCYTQCNGQCVP